MKPVALQLYSLRAEAEKDFPGVLRRVAEVGYKGVEPAGLWGYEAKEVGKMIADLGMTACSVHTGLPTPENIGSFVELAQGLGTTKIVCGFGEGAFDTLEACQQAAAAFSKAEELLEPYGMSFAFHNHWWEFLKLDDKYVYDILMREAPNVCSELDVYWTAFAKADPVEVISKYKSRLRLLHIKDGNLGEPADVMTAVGSGLLSMPEIINSADPNVLEWLIVELDNCATDMFEAVEASYTYLTSHGLAEGNK